jgi:hypothetical protein
MGAAWAGDRFGLFPSMQVLIVVNAVSILLISTVAVHWVFIVANILQSLTNLVGGAFHTIFPYATSTDTINLVGQ